MMNIRHVKVDEIVVRRERRRAVGDVSSLADSIRDLGHLLNPLTVTEELQLVAGGRRLAAVKSLGWEKVAVHVVSLTEVQASLAEIDENLIRSELTTLERSEQLHRRKQLYEALHPETKAGTAGGRASGISRQKAVTTPTPKSAPDKNRTNERISVVGFARDTAAKTGVTERSIQFGVQVAAKIDRRARDLIRETPVADSQADLLKLARAEPAVQLAAAKKLKDGEAKNADQAIRAVARDEKKAELVVRAKAADVAIAERHAGGELPWTLVVGDCVAELARLPSASARLVFADPPYNIGRDYHGKGASADRLPDEQYLAFCEAWARECARVLTDDGSLWVLVSDDYADDVGVILRRQVGLHRRAWVKWYETFGVNRARNFGRCSRHLFYMVKDERRFVFNEAAVLGPSARLHVYGDKRADPAGKILDDVWGVPWIGDRADQVVPYDPLPRMNGNHSERIPEFDNQLPLSLVRRVVACASDPGDRVVDPFNGTGTTGVAAVTAGRLYTGIELDAAAVRVAGDRIKTEYANAQDATKRSA